MTTAYTLPGMPQLTDIVTEVAETIVNGWYPVFDEQNRFVSGTYFYSLDAGDKTPKDVYDILSVRGTKDGTEYTFVANTDYALYDSNNNGKYDTFRWLTSGSNPDTGTIFYVSYRYKITETGLTDVLVGSVLRTVIEAFSVQMNRLFLKAQEVGRDAYVDTAIGRRLDYLGRLVGTVRNEATRTTGYLTLRRDATSTNTTIEIPVGSRFSTIGSSTNASVQFQVTKAARIRSGETTAVTYTSTSDPDHLQPWVAVECIVLGTIGNVSSNSVIRNTNAPPQITYVNNPSTYDVSGEIVSGDGSTQVFTLAHAPASTSSLGTKYLEYKSGFIKQSSINSVIKVTLDNGVDDYDNGGGESLTVKVYGKNSLGNDANESLTLHSAQLIQTTSTVFDEIYYVTFANSDDANEGVGEGIGSASTVTIEATTPDPDETLLNAQAPGIIVDSGKLDMVADDSYIYLYLWQNNSWVLKNIGTTGSGSNNYYYVDEDTGSFDAGFIYWDDGEGGGSTWTGSSPYYSNYAAGPNADGVNIRIEYYPIAGETGTGSATAKETGITAINVTNEYHYGWIDQPASASAIHITTTASWSGTCVIHGTTTSGGVDDEVALTFSAETAKSTGSTEFTKVEYVTFSNADNPSQGIGEGTYSSVQVRIGTQASGTELQPDQYCGTRVDGGYLSLVGVDSDSSLKVYVWDSEWVLHTQANGDFTYSDSGTGSGVIDWGSTWDDATPYYNYHSSGPFADGRNVKIEYVPVYDQYSTSGEQLSLEGKLTNGSTLTLSYTWANIFSDGANTETDDNYRSRIMTALSAAAKGTLAALEANILAIEGIEGVTVNDHSTDPTIEVGEVHISAWTSTGLLDSGTRSLVVGVVEVTRAAGIKPLIQSPIPIYIAISGTVVVDTGSSSTLADVQNAVEDAIINYISGLGIGTPMYKGNLIDVIESVDDVKYFKVNTLVVRGYDSPTATTVSTVSPYSSSPNWYFDEVAGSGQDWSSDGNIIYINTGYVFRPDTDDTGGDPNYAINITVEYG